MDNKYNILITRKQVEEILGRPICNVEVYQRAFVHESYYQSVQNAILNRYDNNTEISYIPCESNERLEFLGDSILKSIIGRYLYIRFTNEREGFLTKIKIKIEQRGMLYKFAERFNFKKFLLLSKEVEDLTVLDLDRGRNTPSYYEDAFEAFIGAILIDFGIEGYGIADKFVTDIIEEEVDFSDLIYINDNYKETLQKYYQSIKIPLPKYNKIKNNGRIFTVAITIPETIATPEQVDFDKRYIATYGLNKIQGNVIVSVGYGKKVVDAEQNAAKSLLEKIGSGFEN